MTAKSPTAKRHREAYNRQWRAEKPHKTREYWLKRYGITEDTYTILLTRQGGTCALCNKTPDQEPRGVLNIDHDHETLQVRGLLCTRHNNGLGMLGDNEAGLLRALKYVRGE